MKHFLRSMAAWLLLAMATPSHACTNLIVGKKASADGSVMITYNADDYGSYGYLRHYPAAQHPKGTMRKLYLYRSAICLRMCLLWKRQSVIAVCSCNMTATVLTLINGSDA